VDFPFKVKSSAMKILQAREGVHIKFMYETLQIISYEVGAHQRHWISKFAPMSVLVPSPKEQQRIADCLASLDELIAAHNAKLDALKAHKSGLLQQLFPAEGETVPRLRFPEFQNAGAWEEKRLGEISEIRTGPFGSVLHESDYVDIGTPIITVEHLDELGIKGKDFPRVSDLDKVRLSAYQLQEGDIVFSRVGSVDRSSIVGANEDGWLFSGRLLRLRMRKPKENSPQFLNQLLKHESSKAKIRNRAVGQTMPSLNTEILNGISFHLPSLIEEQRRIADCLASLDDLITAHSAKLDALRAHKKGLMQQLFPSADEVQG
jgi:type I restriction enzyme S subunit